MNFRLPGISTDAHKEIRELTATLLATERRLTDLTAGEVDAVTDGEGRTFLLQRAQEQLRHREAEKQAAILDGLPARIALLDAAGTIASVNGPWRRFIGGKSKLGAEFGLGLNYAEICDAVQGDRTPEARQMAAGVRSVLRGESTSFSIEYSDGAAADQRWFQTLVTPLSGAGANGAIVMHLDISERRQIERDLKEARVAAVVRESSNRYDFLADTVPLIIWTARADGRVDYFNKAWFEFTGGTPAQPKDEDWQSVVHPDDLPRCLARWTHSYTTGEDYEIEYRFKRADGGYRWFLGRATARRDEKNQIVQWVGTGTDIDDQKRTVTELLSGQVELERRVAIRTAELSIINRALETENAERTKTEIALRESNEKFHQLAENITDAFWIRSPDLSEVHYVSPAFAQIWGRPVETLYANPQRWTEFIFPEDQARVLAAFAALTTTAPSLDIEYRIVRPDGEIRWVRVRGFKSATQRTFLSVTSESSPISPSKRRPRRPCAPALRSFGCSRNPCRKSCGSRWRMAGTFISASNGWITRACPSRKASGMAGLRPSIPTTKPAPWRRGRKRRRRAASTRSSAGCAKPQVNTTGG